MKPTSLAPLRSLLGIFVCLCFLVQVFWGPLHLALFDHDLSGHGMGEHVHVARHHGSHGHGHGHGKAQHGHRHGAGHETPASSHEADDVDPRTDDSHPLTDHFGESIEPASPRSELPSFVAVQPAAIHGLSFDPRPGGRAHLRRARLHPPPRPRPAAPRAPPASV